MIWIPGAIVDYMVWLRRPTIGRDNRLADDRKRALGRKNAAVDVQHHRYALQIVGIPGPATVQTDSHVPATRILSIGPAMVLNNW